MTLILFPQIIDQLNANQQQMASNLSLANLIQMQPTFINFCIKSVESAVQTKISKMEIVAAKCQNCSACAQKGYFVPPYINNTCPIPVGAGSVLISTFNKVSSALATLESDWQNYRDDEFEKKIISLQKLTSFIPTILNWRLFSIDTKA